MVNRKENWPQLLSEFLEERRKLPFVWGENDCMASVAKLVHKLTGTDFFEAYSNYNSEESAKLVLEANGGVSGIITKCLGSGTKNILTAKRGDVAIIKLPEVTGAFVDDSGQNIVAVSREGGFVRYPLNKAWRVWSY